MVAGRVLVAGARAALRHRDGTMLQARSRAALAAVPVSQSSPSAEIQSQLFRSKNAAAWKRPRSQRRRPMLAPGAELPEQLTEDVIQALCQRSVPGWSVLPKERKVSVDVTFDNVSEYLDASVRNQKRVQALQAAGLNAEGQPLALYSVDAAGQPLDEEALQSGCSSVAFPVCVKELHKQDSMSTHEITVGLSNRNFRVDAEGTTGPKAVLFRAYGASKSDLYDGDLELRIVELLSHYDVAPKLFASGPEWRIEEWYVGSKPLKNQDMRNPSILGQVASQLARLHKLSARADFPADIGAMPALSGSRLSQWGDCAASSKIDAAEGFNVNAVLGERQLLQNLLHASSFTPGCGMDVVFSHWDAQENNILRTNYGLRLIDFEYAGMEHQAFDVANYFIECSIDYLAEEYPFFKVNPENYPTAEERRLFCSVYLSEYLGRSVNPGDAEVQELERHTQKFTLMANYLWTLWSVMRASQASEAGSFDYMAYARSRWEMYLRAKEGLVE